MYHYISLILLESSREFDKLSTAFPSNLFILNEQAQSLYDAERWEQALVICRRMHKIDKYSFQGMKIYSQLLYRLGDSSELTIIANNLISADPRRPEGWIAASLHSELKGEKDKAMEFIDKALQVNPKCITALNIKGVYYLTRDKPEQSAIAFSQANSIEKNVESYNGM